MAQVVDYSPVTLSTLPLVLLVLSLQLGQRVEKTVWLSCSMLWGSSILLSPRS